jgi:hypothetical protein
MGRPGGTRNQTNQAHDVKAAAAGIAQCLGLQAEARVELEEIVNALQAEISSTTLFTAGLTEPLPFPVLH